MIEQRNRHEFTIEGGGQNAARHIVLRIVARGHFLRLQERAFARAHIIIEELFRRRHRRIGKTDDIRIIFGAAMQSQRIGLLIESDGVFLAGLAIMDDDARQTVVAFDPDKMVLIG